MPTQNEIAEHLGISQKSVSVQMSNIGLDYKSMSMDEIRLAYIDHLRDMASNASYVDDEIDGRQEKARLDKANREIKEFELAILRKEMISIKDIQAADFQFVESIKSAFLTIPQVIKTDAMTLHEVDWDIESLNEYFYAVLDDLSGRTFGFKRAQHGEVEEVGKAGEADDHAVGEKAPRNKRKSKRNTGQVSS